MRDGRLVWVDLEMTGLNPATCTIVEIATVVTESDLSIVAEGPNLVIYQAPEVLERMDEVVVELHRRSGLLERISASTVSLEEAADQTLTFLKAHCDANTAPLCGNSVWKDRQFLERYTPELATYCHYRIVDVSTIKELVRRWYGGAHTAPKKRGIHRALDDIRESIEELRWYREHVFVTVPP